MLHFYLYNLRTMSIHSPDNLPQLSNEDGHLEENFNRFFEWATEIDPDELNPDVLSDQFRTRRHSLNFKVIYLAVNGLYSARLHVYEAGSPPDDDVHNHSFNFFSGVVVGGLTQTLYDVHQGKGSGVASVCYRDALGAQHLKQVPESYVADPIDEMTLDPGETYSLKTSDFHAVGDTKTTTMTLMVKEQQQPNRPALVLKPRALELP